VSSTSDRVVIGMDPHKRSATIEVMTGEETMRPLSITLDGARAPTNFRSRPRHVTTPDRRERVAVDRVALSAA
jgi:hypothetical protein